MANLFSRTRTPRPETEMYPTSQPEYETAEPGTADSPDMADPFSDAAPLTAPDDSPAPQAPEPDGPVFLGPNGEWEPGDDELGPPVMDPVLPPDEKGGGVFADSGLGLPETGDPGETGGLLPTSGNDVQTFRNALLGLFNGGPVSASSSFLQPAITAHRNANQRGLDRARALVAERAAYGFGPVQSNSGGFESQLQGLNSDYARDEADYEGNLVANANDSEMQRRLAALGLFGNLYNTQAGLGLNQAQFESSQNQQALLALLNALAQQGAF